MVTRRCQDVREIDLVADAKGVTGLDGPEIAVRYEVGLPKARLILTSLLDFVSPSHYTHPLIACGGQAKRQSLLETLHR